MKSLKADGREISERASPPSEETTRSKISFPPVEGVSLVRDGQKPPAPTEDTTTPMSESTLRIIAYHKNNKGKLPGTWQYDFAFWDTITLEQRKRYYIETGRVIRMFLLSVLPSLT